jgi:hypothetical protein
MQMLYKNSMSFGKVFVEEMHTTTKETLSTSRRKVHGIKITIIINVCFHSQQCKQSFRT